MSSKKNRIRPPRISGVPKPNPIKAVVVDVVTAAGPMFREIVRDELVRSKGMTFQIVDEPQLPKGGSEDARASAPRSPARNGDSEPKIGQAIGGLDALCKRIDQSVGELVQFSDVRLGPEPPQPAGDNNGSAPPRCGQIGAVIDLIDTGHRLVARLEAELRRLSQL